MSEPPDAAPIVLGKVKDTSYEESLLHQTSAELVQPAASEQTTTKGLTQAEEMCSRAAALSVKANDTSRTCNASAAPAGCSPSADAAAHFVSQKKPAVKISPKKDLAAAAGTAAQLANARAKPSDIKKPEQPGAAYAAAALAKVAATSVDQASPPAPSLSTAGASASLKHERGNMKLSDPNTSRNQSMATKSQSYFKEASSDTESGVLAREETRSGNPLKAGMPRQRSESNPSKDVLRAATLSMKNIKPSSGSSPTFFAQASPTVHPAHSDALQHHPTMSRSLRPQKASHNSPVEILHSHSSDQVTDQQLIVAAADASFRKDIACIDERMTDIDHAKIEQDQQALLAAAQRIAQEKVNAIEQQQSNERIRDPNGWNEAALEEAERRSRLRSVDNCKIDLGGGKLMTREEIDEIARLNVQPVLDEISNEVDRKLAHDEEIRIQKESELRLMHETKQRQKDEKEHERQMKLAEKEERKRWKASQLELERGDKQALKLSKLEQKETKQGRKQTSRSKNQDDKDDKHKGVGKWLKGVLRRGSLDHGEGTKGPAKNFEEHSALNVAMVNAPGDVSSSMLSDDEESDTRDSDVAVETIMSDTSDLRAEGVESDIRTDTAASASDFQTNPKSEEGEFAEVPLKVYASPLFADTTSLASPHESQIFADARSTLFGDKQKASDGDLAEAADAAATTVPSAPRETKFREEL